MIRNISYIISGEKQKNDSKYLELLAAAVSHEMMTPLNAIINLTKYLKSKFINYDSPKTSSSEA